jgi:hypothetical protein
MSTPLIFIHRGNSDYLFYTLTSARLFNPHREIVLLGDASNSYLSRIGITHIPFEQYATDPLLKKFDEVFQCIATPDWNGIEWLQFVFRRWFYVHAFLADRGIDPFWTFDSDTVILRDLTEVEEQYRDYECTTQCRDSCLNGWVGSRNLVRRYVEKTIAIFERTEFLEEERKRLEKMSKNHFNEMKTFGIFRQEENVQTIRSAAILEGYAFDECVCIADGMEVNEYGTKNLYLNPSSGKVLEKEVSSNQFVIMNGINMSWVESLFISQLVHFALQYFNPTGFPSGDVVLMQIPKKEHSS